jgi:hypothetical protein
MTQETIAEKQSLPSEISFAEFLEAHPPNQPVRISKIWVSCNRGGLNPGYRGVVTPEIRLHCGHEACNGSRFFRCITAPPELTSDKTYNLFLTYKCSNCLITEKVFSVSVKMDASPTYVVSSGDALKFGEVPAFGPQTSSRLIKLIGPDRDAFLSGRRCENQGLGIGAFVYYRRVVENQKTRILEEILRVAERVSAKPDTLVILKNAIKEVQFSRALDIAKPAIPESLLINGHNPLGLLHDALSEGLHALTDSECLELAGSIRIVLAELSDRLAAALKDEVELQQALGTLMNRKRS